MKCSFQGISLLTKNLAIELVQWFQNEVNECSVLFGVVLCAGKFASLWVEINVTPETIGEALDIEGTWIIFENIGWKYEVQSLPQV